MNATHDAGPAATRWTGPINSSSGMPIWRRSSGDHHDPGSTQRRIGGSVYIFRPCVERIDVWRLEGLRSVEQGHCWTLVHSLSRTTPDTDPTEES